MIISNSAYINQTYTRQAKSTTHQSLKSSDKAANEAKTDQICFSDRIKDLRKISQAVETAPTDREKYIADIKQKIETNQYTINAETIAEKMVGSFMDKIG